MTRIEPQNQYFEPARRLCHATHRVNPAARLRHNAGGDAVPPRVRRPCQTSSRAQQHIPA
jgi:hypothetical protein